MFMSQHDKYSTRQVRQLVTPKSICGYKTYDRHVSSVNPKRKANRPEVHESTIELDSHADTIVFGRNFLLLHSSGKECSVAPFTDAYKSIKNVPIVTAATAWTSQYTGETYILEFHEGLWMGDTMYHYLINPNQCRAFGIKIQDDPSNGSPLYLATEDLSLSLFLSLSLSHTLFLFLSLSLSLSLDR